MSEITCSIIQDLLPIYKEEIVSEDTRQLVEKHLETCELCRKELEMMDTEIDDTRYAPTEKEEEKIIRSFRRKICKKQMIIAVISMLIAMTVSIIGMKLYHDSKRPDINGNEMIASGQLTVSGAPEEIEQHVVNGVILKKEQRTIYISVPVNERKMKECHVRLLKDGVVLEDTMIAVSDARFVTYCIQNIEELETGLYSMEFYDMEDLINQYKWFRVEDK